MELKVLLCAYGVYIFMIGAVFADETCSSDQFMCNDGRCINRDNTCDGLIHCYDRSDENEVTCPREYVKEILLNVSSSSVKIQHPTNAGSYFPNERINWIISSDDPNAVGFKVDIEGVGLPPWGDELIIPRHDCHFDTNIRSSNDGPLFLNGPVLNVTFTSDSSESSFGFIIEVSAVPSLEESPCPGNEEELFLREDETSLRIRHPENSRHYKNREQYVWMIKNEIPGAAGFEVTFDEIGIEQCCDKLRIEGEHCSYGKHTYLNKSPMTIRGDSLNITWESDHEVTGEGFIIDVNSLQELDKTECYEYTCDDSGRCVRAHYDDLRNWNESQAACEQEGARLVVITDEGMDNLVRNVIDNRYTDPWIGISGDSFNSMTWTTGKSPSDYDYENWNSDWYHRFEDKLCGTYDDDGWESTDCYYYHWPYVCEKL